MDVGYYTPDFLVEFKDGSRTVVEVKPESKMEGFTEKLAQAERQLRDRGIEFVVAHDTLLRHDESGVGFLLRLAATNGINMHMRVIAGGTYEAC
jgi:hypothetical protein